MHLLYNLIFRSLRFRRVKFCASRPFDSLASEELVTPVHEQPEITPAPANEKIKLDKEMLMKLERLSGLRFNNLDEIENLQEDIRIADKLFEINTDEVEPLYSVVEELINCPLRDDIPEDTDVKKILMNAPEIYEDLFVSPKPNIPLTENPLFKELYKLDTKKDS